MDKLIDSGSFSEDWEVTLLSDEPSGLEKAAAANEVVDFSKNIEKKEGKFYIHINAMGAGEYYGANRNGDFFPEDNLKQWYKTFETSPAHVFRHHVNKDPSIAIGKVIFSYYNERMHRVELIAEVDKILGAAELAAIEAGMYPMTSMACNTPYDVCSICNNKARTRSEYCSHLTTQLGKVLADGRKVMSINEGPLKFFDISVVIRPADITSAVLQKVAGYDDQCTVGSAEAAELEGISYGSEKRASIKKIAVEKAADLIKTIPGEIEGHSELLDPILDSIKDPDDSILDTLKSYSLEDIIKSFAFLGLNPSIKFLVKVIANNHIGQREAEISDAVMESLYLHGVNKIPKSAETLVPDILNPEQNVYLIKSIMKFQMDASFNENFVEKRANHDGYTNWQTGRGSVAPSKFFSGNTVLKSTDDADSKSMTLLKVAGAAIIAKIMISTLVGMPKAAEHTGGVDETTNLTIKLMDLSIHRELKGINNV